MFTLDPNLEMMKSYFLEKKMTLDKDDLFSSKWYDVDKVLSCEGQRSVVAAVVAFTFSYRIST